MATQPTRGRGRPRRQPQTEQQQHSLLPQNTPTPAPTQPLTPASSVSILPLPTLTQTTTATPTQVSARRPTSTRPSRNVPPPTRTVNNPFCLRIAQADLRPIDYSLTISKMGSDVAESLLERCHIIGEHYFVKHFFTTERGSREQNLHVQGVFTAMSQNTPRATTAAAACFKAEIPISTTERMRVSVKPLTGT